MNALSNSKDLCFYVAGIAADANRTQVFATVQQNLKQYGVLNVGIDGRHSQDNTLFATPPTQQLEQIEATIRKERPDRVFAVGHCFGTLATQAALSEGLITDKVVMVAPSLTNQADTLRRASSESLINICIGARLMVAANNSVSFDLASGSTVVFPSDYFDDPLLFNDERLDLDLVDAELNSGQVSVVLADADWNAVPKRIFGSEGALHHPNIVELPGSHAFNLHPEDLTVAASYITDFLGFSDSKLSA